MVYLKDGSGQPHPAPSKSELSNARFAKRLLDSWITHPALNTEGGPNESALKAWVGDVRRRCALSQRVVPGDIEIGKLLASSPPVPDGSWPCIAVRNILEGIPGDDALVAFRNEIFNNRGGTSRGVHAGGNLERQLVKHWHQQADACQMRWPRVSAALRQLAKIYEADARQMDERADDRV